MSVANKKIEPHKVFNYMSVYRILKFWSSRSSTLSVLTSLNFNVLKTGTGLCYSLYAQYKLHVFLAVFVDFHKKATGTHISFQFFYLARPI